MIILKEERRILQEKSNTHINIPFIVPFDGKKLVIKFSYFPKQVVDEILSLKLIQECLETFEPTKIYRIEELNNFLPLNNMLTLSIDSPEGFLGTAHRQMSEQRHIISETESSRGFIKQKVQKGEWNITISVYPLISPFVDFELEVSLA